MDYKVTLGSAENGKELVWSVRTNPHAYLSGKSGSGKSYKLRELIAQLPGQGIRCHRMRLFQRPFICIERRVRGKSAS